jgi:hypothetical protein
MVVQEATIMSCFDKCFRSLNYNPFGIGMVLIRKYMYVLLADIPNNNENKSIFNGV